DLARDAALDGPAGELLGLLDGLAAEQSDLHPVPAEPGGGAVGDLRAPAATRGGVDQQVHRPDVPVGEPGVQVIGTQGIGAIGGAHGISVPGLHTPCGSTADLTARSIRAPTSPISDSR